MKVALSSSNSGFNPPIEAQWEYWDRKGVPSEDQAGFHKVDRSDPDLVSICETLLAKGEKEWAWRFRIEDVPTGSHYIIEELDGVEIVLIRDDVHWKVAS